MHLLKNTNLFILFYYIWSSFCTNALQSDETKKKKNIFYSDVFLLRMKMWYRISQKKILQIQDSIVKELLWCNALGFLNGFYVYYV